MAIKLRDHYDWVVLGDHPGSLLTASMTARLGLSVLVVPFVTSSGRYISPGGQCLDPETNYLIGLRALVRSNGLLLECLRRSGMLQSEEGHLVQKDDFFPQVLTTQSRISFPLADDDVKLEFQREFGKALSDKIGIVEALKESEPEFLRYWFHLPDRLTLSDGKNEKGGHAVPRAIDSLRAKLAKDSNLSPKLRNAWFSKAKSVKEFSKELDAEDFENIAHGLWFGASGAPVADPSLMDALHLLALGRSGAAFRGGLSAYREFLLRLAKRSGAQVLDREVCRRIFLTNGQMTGVQVSNYGNMITVGGGVLGSPLKEAHEILTISGKKLFRSLRAPLTPIGWKFTIALTVGADAIAPGVSHRMVWQEKGAPPLEIEIADPVDYSIREHGTRLIFLRTVVPYESETLKSSYLRLLARRMFRQLTEIIPFVEFHVVRVFPDFRGDESGRLLRGKISGDTATESFELVYGITSLEKIPFNWLCFSKEGVGSHSGIEGLFVASDESFPMLGTLGGTVAAVEAVAWIAHRMGLSGPLVSPNGKENRPIKV